MCLSAPMADRATAVMHDDNIHLWDDELATSDPAALHG